MHGVDLDARVVERKDLVGLQTVGKEAAGQRRADDERDDGVPGGARGVVGVDGAGHRLV